jgi:ribosomal protein S18 acetylase RimI-like enzyme
MITVKEITTKKDLKKFADFPNHLYKGNPYYVPPFFSDELKTLRRDTNLAYDYCDAKFFLAYDNKKIVGRIGAIINHAYNEKKNVKQIRFTRFDTIDDPEISRLLFREVIRYGKEQGMKEVVGPLGFNDLDKQGMLIEGFEEESNTITTYNYPYYPKHIENLGFKKDVDWVEYQVWTPKELDDRIPRLSEAIQKRYGFHIVKLKSRKEIPPYITDVFKIYNAAFAPLYGMVPVKDNQVKELVKQFVPLLNLEYLYLVTNSEDKLIGFGLMLPSLNAATKKSRGRLFPFGIFRALKAIKTGKVLDMYLIAVLPEYQNRGVNALILAEGVKSFVKNGIRYCETGPELELNEPVQSQWKTFETRQHRRRRSFILQIDQFHDNII